MACDLFCSITAKQLLSGKCLYIFGDSNIRAMYKDLLWLLESGTLISEKALKTKNEVSFANDLRVSNGVLHSGRNYTEIREYKENPFIKFQFITRLFTQEFLDTIMNMNHLPDIIIISSCVWDLTRWGINGVEQYKKNLFATFDFLKTYLPTTVRIIWLTALPPSFESKGGFLTREIEFLRSILPWHVLFANNYASDIAKLMDIDILDLHHHFRFILDHHTTDGIHWTPSAIRYATNMLLTHIALVQNFQLPNNLPLDSSFLIKSQVVNRRHYQNQNTSYFFNDGLQSHATSNSFIENDILVPNITNKRSKNVKHKTNKQQCNWRYKLRKSKKNQRNSQYHNRNVRHH